MFMSAVAWNIHPFPAAISNFARCSLRSNTLRRVRFYPTLRCKMKHTSRVAAALRKYGGVICATSATAGLVAYSAVSYCEAPPASKSTPAVAGRVSVGVSNGLLDTIGNTPLIELKSLSAVTGCRILAKAEHMNPGGSVKDRPAAMIIKVAEDEGRLVPRSKRDAAQSATAGSSSGWLSGLFGGAKTPAPVKEYTVVEGTGGNTGVGMALVAAARGYKAIFTMPANVSQEKIDIARTFGAEVVVCPVVGFNDPAHYYHRAKQIAESTPGAVWGSQFENLANMRAHYEGTGPEIWSQAGGKVDGLVLAAGTGGTIAGLSKYLKEQNEALRVFLIDPPGSSLAGYIETGAMTSAPGSTITEGIGIGRLTANFATAKVDGVFRGTDQEAIDMAYYLLKREGVFVGPSAALNVCGAVKLARKLGPGHTIVTVLCDGGDRYRTKMYNQAWMAERGLKTSADFGKDNADFVH